MSPEGRGVSLCSSAPCHFCHSHSLVPAHHDIDTHARDSQTPRDTPSTRHALGPHFSFATWLARLGRAPAGGEGRGDGAVCGLALGRDSRVPARAAGRGAGSRRDPRPARGRRPARPPAPPPRGRRVPPPGPARRPTPRGAPTASNPPPGPEVFLHRYRNSLLVLPVRTRPHVRKVYRHSLPARATPAEERAGGPRAGSCTFRRAARG